jgi:hypothetical protein
MILMQEIKKTIWHGLEWNYNDIDVEITWRYQIYKQQFYPVPIVYDDSFKKMIDFFYSKWFEHDNIVCE